MLQPSWPPRNVWPGPLSRDLGEAQDGLSLRKPGILLAHSYHRDTCTTTILFFGIWFYFRPPSGFSVNRQGPNLKSTYFIMSLHCSVGTVTTLWDEWYRIIPKRAQQADQFCGPLSPLFSACLGLLPRKWGWDMMLTTRLHLVPTLWIYGDAPPLRHKP